MTERSPRITIEEAIAVTKDNPIVTPKKVDKLQKRRIKKSKEHKQLTDNDILLLNELGASDLFEM